MGRSSLSPPSRTLTRVKILAARRPHGDTSADAVHWTVEADSYEAALDLARADVPEGWDLLSIQTVD